MLSRDEYLKHKWQPYPEAPKEVLYSGRVISVSTKGSFLVLKTERHQLVSQYSIPGQLEWLEILRPGDLVAIDGSETLHFLAPGQPISSPLPVQTLLNWQKYLQAVRDFFTTAEFLEINTPSLVECPGTEPSLEVFETEMKQGPQKKKLFLPTSPELHLKKAMVYGFDKIFEIKNCFRNDEFSDHHQPEFWMLEWYRAYTNLDSLQQDVKNLINFVFSKFPDEPLKWPQRLRIVTVAELFKQYTGFEITPWTTLEEYQGLCSKLNLEVRGATTIDDYFFAIFIDKIETQFSPEELIFVKDYPPFQAALARINSRGWADRMEVYFGGFELANAFHELNDPKIQAQRFAEDLAKKKAAGKNEINLDKEFMSLLEKGLPPSAGIALGLDRLFMALFGISKIKDLKLFPY